MGVQNLSGNRVALLSLTPARRWCASPPPLHDVERGQAKRSEAGGEATASVTRITDNLCTHPKQCATPAWYTTRREKSARKASERDPKGLRPIGTGQQLLAEFISDDGVGLLFRGTVWNKGAQRSETSHCAPCDAGEK